MGHLRPRPCAPAPRRPMGRRAYCRAGLYLATLARPCRHTAMGTHDDLPVHVLGLPVQANRVHLHQPQGILGGLRERWRNPIEATMSRRGSSAPRLSALSPPPVSACPSRPAATRGIPTGTPHPVAGGRVWAEPRCGRQQARAQAQRLDGCRERARLRRRRLAGVACPTRPAGGGAATSARVGGSRQAQAGAAVAHH
jgi:hypothetical protein